MEDVVEEEADASTLKELRELEEKAEEERRKLNERIDVGLGDGALAAMEVDAGAPLDVTEEYITRSFENGAHLEMLEGVKRLSAEMLDNLLRGKPAPSKARGCQIAVWILRSFLSAVKARGGEEEGAEEEAATNSAVTSLLSLAGAEDKGEAMRLLFRHRAFAGARASLDEYHVMEFLRAEQRGGWAAIDPSVAAAWACEGKHRLKELLLAEGAVKILISLGVEGIRRGGSGQAAATSLLVSVAASDYRSLRAVAKELCSLKGAGEGGGEEEEERGHKALLFVYAECYDKLSLTNDTKKILLDAASRYWKEVRR